MNRLDIKKWGLACQLTIPVFIFFAAYLFNHTPDLAPTGFIQFDNVSYIAYAHQYLEADSFHLQYSNPFADHEGPHIYFQPQTLLFALLLKTGIPAGWILVPFTLICAVVCFRLVIAIYDFLVPAGSSRIFSIWLFAWGGGLLVICGTAAHFLLQRSNNIGDDLFMLDPEHGWWGLNFGRSIFFSCEAYYHALFLGCVYSLLKQKWAAGLCCMFVLLFSHPFTGIELIAIVCAWVVVEFARNRNSLPWWFIIGSAFIFFVYIFYYFIYLNQFPDHRSVAAQYSLNWRLGWYRILPAYSLVALGALLAFYKTGFKKYWSSPPTRLFFCWFLVAFLLANHEWFIKPRQPVHFTRGYIWTALFLLGLPALRQLMIRIKKSWGVAVLAIAGLVFFLDNAAWIAVNTTRKADEPSTAYISKEQEEVLKQLALQSTSRSLLVGSDPSIAYLATVHTPGWPWLSHPYTTPFAAEKRRAYDEFVQTGRIDTSWNNRKLVFLFHSSEMPLLAPYLKNIPAIPVWQSANYQIFVSDSSNTRQ